MIKYKCPYCHAAESNVAKEFPTFVKCHCNRCNRYFAVFRKESKAERQPDKQLTSAS